jgi:hypothetical protein
MESSQAISRILMEKVCFDHVLKPGNKDEGPAQARHEPGRVDDRRRVGLSA